jgi:threonine-phosphate decarboxylase
MLRSPDHGGNVFDVARQLGVAPAAISDFSASINPLGISAMVRRAIIDSIDSLVHYPDTGHGELKQALANHHGLSPDNIVIANGSTELIYQVPALIPGKRALIISPSFSEYTRALSQQQWEVQHFILDHGNNFFLDLEALELALAEGFDALYLCNPANPGGTLYPADLIKQVCGLCSASGTFLVLDEAFMDFCEESSAKHVMIGSDTRIVLRSMTKFFALPGLRLGYAIASRSLAERLHTFGGPWGVNTPALAAGIAALHDSGHNRSTLEYIHQQRKNLVEQLSEFSQLTVFPSSVNFLLLQISDGMSALELRERVLQERMLIRDCSNFIGLTDRFFRIAVRTAEENDRLAGCLKGILK